MKDFKEIIESLFYCNCDTNKCSVCHYNTEEYPHCYYSLENDMLDLNELIKKLLEVNKNG